MSTIWSFFFLISQSPYFNHYTLWVSVIVNNIRVIQWFISKSPKCYWIYEEVWRYVFAHPLHYRQGVIQGQFLSREKLVWWSSRLVAKQILKKTLLFSLSLRENRCIHIFSMFVWRETINFIWDLNHSIS